MNNELQFILGIAVLSPVVGSILGVIKRPKELLIYNMLAFAGGIMLAISFLELIPESMRLSSLMNCIVGFIIGCLVMYLVDHMIPNIQPSAAGQRKHNLQKTSIYLLIGIFIHNLPEGMAMAVGTVKEAEVGSLVIASAIAVHNIPEGICTAAAYYHCTKKRIKSFLVSSATALPILFGFLFAYFIFQNISTHVMGLVTAVTAGLMIYISLDELIPSSSRKISNHSTIFSLISGILFVLLLGNI